MHEHKLARDLVPTFEKLARDNNLVRISRLVIDFGMLQAVEPDFLIHSFEHAFEGNPLLEGATVVVNVITPGTEITDPTGLKRPATGFEIIVRTIEGEEG